MLKLFDKHQCIFFHIPKTGGISVTKSLFGEISWGHRDVYYYKRVFGKKRFNSYYKFTFVRNPYHRLYSAYYFLKKGGITPQDLEFSQKYLTHVSSFEQFVQDELHKKEILNWIHFRPQTDYLTDKKGRLAVDFIGYFERFEPDFEVVCQQLNIEAALQHLNKTSEQNAGCDTIYTSELKKKVYSVYEKDFQLLGYSGK